MEELKHLPMPVTLLESVYGTPWCVLQELLNRDLQK